VLRDGMYISDGDVHMKLEGVYVKTWGELRMVLSRYAWGKSLKLKVPVW